MLGCHIGRCFQVTVAGGSYQEGLTSVLQGIQPGLLVTEQRYTVIYCLESRAPMS